MSSPLLQAGAQPDKPQKNAPLHINRFFSGLISNRSPLREGAVPYLYEKFYSGARFDSVLSGQNTELTPRLTWARRPGLSVYNSQSFNSPNTFYPFRVTNPNTGAETIRTIVDTPTAVYDGTGPSTKILLFTKGTGAGQTSFQGVGNTLFMGDGVDTKQWLWYPGWQASFEYEAGTVIIDSNGNLQFMQGAGLSLALATSVVVTADVLYITLPGVGYGLAAGTEVTFSGLTGLTALNGETLACIGEQIISFDRGIYLSTVFTFSFTHANYNATSETGTMTGDGLSGESGLVAPTWATSFGASTTDNAVTWIMKGPQVQSWGFAGPTAAPVVANAAGPTYPTWAASTFYWNSLVIEDPNSNIQLLTTAGTTNSSRPSFNTSGTTTDGTAVWTYQGSAAWTASHAYTAGYYVAVSYNTTYTITIYNPVTRQTTTQTFTVSHSDMFQSQNAGTSGTTAPTWNAGIGSTVTDGGIVWTNVGAIVTRGTGSSGANVIGNSTLVTLNTYIADSNGNQQNPTSAGISGGSTPGWSTVLGGTTRDGSVTWTEAGPLAAVNTGSWVYGYAFKNSVTGHVSTMSPASQPIILAAQSYIALSGNIDPNYATDGVDTIEIYRTVQGTTTPLFFLADIPMPLGGTWSYSDASPDPPNSSSILNEFITADVTGTNAPPPANLIGLTYHLSRVWGVSGEYVVYSQVQGAEVGVGADSWSAENFFQMPAIPTVLWPSAAGIFMFLTDSIWLSSGLDTNGNPLEPAIYLDQTGSLSPNVFTVNGSVPVIFASDTTEQILDPSAGVQFVSLPIADLLATFSPTAAYVTWHSFGTDQGYYIADGSTGWYRLTPISPPESGYAWCTKANIVGGCKCVKSIETSPGTRNLLIGYSGTGPILKRDLTTNADNGTAYLANTVIGSIVLAQPNQCAEVVSITSECIAVGSRPVIGILADEISGNFENLPIRIQDPPFLADPQSVYSDRWYFSTLQQPAWLRHMQLNFQWPAEDAANELLTYSIYGSIHSE